MLFWYPPRCLFRFPVCYVYKFFGGHFFFFFGCHMWSLLVSKKYICRYKKKNTCIKSLKLGGGVKTLDDFSAKNASYFFMYSQIYPWKCFLLLQLCRYWLYPCRHKFLSGRRKGWRVFCWRWDPLLKKWLLPGLPSPCSNWNLLRYGSNL